MTATLDFLPSKPIECSWSPVSAVGRRTIFFRIWRDWDECYCECRPRENEPDDDEPCWPCCSRHLVRVLRGLGFTHDQESVPEEARIDPENHLQWPDGLLVEHKNGATVYCSSWKNELGCISLCLRVDSNVGGVFLFDQVKRGVESHFQTSGLVIEDSDCDGKNGLLLDPRDGAVYRLSSVTGYNEFFDPRYAPCLPSSLATKFSLWLRLPAKPTTTITPGTEEGEELEVARSLWGYHNPKVRSVGPTLEMMEVAAEFRGKGLGKRFYRCCEHIMLKPYSDGLQAWAANPENNSRDRDVWLPEDVRISICDCPLKSQRDFFLQFGFYGAQEMGVPLPWEAGFHLLHSVYYRDDRFTEDDPNAPILNPDTFADEMEYLLAENSPSRFRDCFRPGSSDCFEFVPEEPSSL